MSATNKLISLLFFSLLVFVPIQALAEGTISQTANPQNNVGGGLQPTGSGLQPTVNNFVLGDSSVLSDTTTQNLKVETNNSSQNSGLSSNDQPSSEHEAKLISWLLYGGTTILGVLLIAVLVKKAKEGNIDW